MNPEKMARLLALEKELKSRPLLNYRPYPKQAEFHTATKNESIRYQCLFAGNQEGKTQAGAAHVAYHATGLYPDWWDGGKRFKRPVRIVYGGNSAMTTRDTPQAKLFGEHGEPGLLPKHMIHNTVTARGVPGLFESAEIKHTSGGFSKIYVRSFDQGRDKWQSLANIDLVWFDEEPPFEIWDEGTTRLNAGNDGAGGYAILTATPLLGVTEVVDQFFPSEKNESFSLTLMGLNDVPEWPVGHLQPAQRKALENKYPEYIREARLNGIPSLGSGQVFPVAEESITCDPFEIPPHWFHVIGIDFGWDHPTAAVHMVIDRDHGDYYIVNTYAQAKVVVPIHASAIKPWGPHPVAWPHDGYVHDKQSGDEIAGAYRREGLKMMAQHATHPAGGYGTEAGVQELAEAMQTGHFKVFANQGNWFREFRQYHRQHGQIVKKKDDLMSATRMAWMMRRNAKSGVRKEIQMAKPGRYNPMQRATQQPGWMN